MSIKEKEGKKKEENIQDNLQILKHEVTKDIDKSGVNMSNKKLHPTILYSIVCVFYAIPLILK